MSLTWFLLLLVISWTGRAFSEQAILQETEWTWEPGGTATFSGSFTVDGPDVSNASWHRELETATSVDPETGVFTEINEKTIRIRKRSCSQTADVLGNGQENTFLGEWYLPEDGVSQSHAVLRLKVEDEEGNLITSAELKLGGESGSVASPASTILSWMQKGMIVFAALAVLLWAAAIIRSRVIHRKHA